jgi:hypothetical protein
MYITYTTIGTLTVGKSKTLLDIELGINASPTDDPFVVEEAFINGFNADELGLMDFVDEIVDQNYDEIYRLAGEAAQDYADQRAEAMREM